MHILLSFSVLSGMGFAFSKAQGGQKLKHWSAWCALSHRYCGRSVPPSLTSSERQLTLLFVSDYSLSLEGFSASYVSINATTGQRHATVRVHQSITRLIGEEAPPTAEIHNPDDHTVVRKRINVNSS